RCPDPRVPHRLAAAGGPCHRGVGAPVWRRERPSLGGWSAGLLPHRHDHHRAAHDRPRFPRARRGDAHRAGGRVAMVMIAIVDEAGQPMYRQSRDLIRPELSHALGRWRREVEMSLTAEHDAAGAHVDLRFPKAVIWITRLDRSGSIHPASIIRGQRVSSGDPTRTYIPGTRYHFGDLTFAAGVPGQLVLLHTRWWPQGSPVPIIRWRIAGNTIELRYDTQAQGTVLAQQGVGVLIF